MTDERRKMLTIAMGECAHEFYEIVSGGAWCLSCGQSNPALRTFNNPNDFFALWNWAKEQSWWNAFVFIARVNMDDILEREGKPVVNSFLGLIDPIRFPELVAEFLEKEADHERT